MQRHFWMGLGIALLLFLQGCKPYQPPTELERIRQRGYLLVGTTYSPVAYYHGNSDGVDEHRSGLDYELARRFADYLGVRLKMRPSYNLADLFPKLQSGQVDLLAAGLAVTEKRSRAFRYAPRYYQVQQVVVYRKGDWRPRDLDDLKEHPLTVVAASSHAELLRRLSKAHPDLLWNETREYDNEELLRQVAEGEQPYTITDSTLLARNRQYYPELARAFTLTDPQPVSWLLRRDEDDSLLAATVEFFGKLRRDGTLTVLQEKYFGHVTQFDYVDTRSFMRAVENVLPNYQHLFEKYADTFDWRLLAAISYQESHWDPRAKSPTGVRGMMMLTQPTAKAMGVANRLDPDDSIRGGARYLRKLINRVPDSIHEEEKIWFALAAYNVGFGHMMDARRLTRYQGGDADRWTDVKSRLPLLQKKRWIPKTRYGYARGGEAARYVDNIRRYYHSLRWVNERQQKQLAQEQPHPVDDLPQENATEDASL